MDKYCSVCGKELNKNYKRGLCDKHYNEFLEYGFFITDTQRDKNDPNEIVKYEDHAEITLYDNITQEELEETVIFDLEDYDKVKGIRFDLNRKCVATRINGDIVLLQNYLLDTNDRVEFINGDYLDFRKENLKVVKKEVKVKRVPYVINKKDKNKIIIEFIGNSRNGVVGSSVLVSYPIGNGKYEKILLENGMIQKNGVLNDEYIINKEMVDITLNLGELEGVFLSHAHLARPFRIATSYGR